MKKLILSTIFLGLLAACNNPFADNDGSNKAVYKAPKDVCGEIIFQEKIGEDFQQALDEILKRKMIQGWDNIFLETKKLRVVTNLRGNEINKNLYLVVVKDKDTNRKVHAWNEVIDDVGNLYFINWCPD